MLELLRMLRGTGRELRKRVRDGEPRGLGPHPEMRERATRRVVVEDTEPQTQDVRGTGTSAVERGATTTTEGTEYSGRRFEFPDELLARNELPVLSSDVG